MADDSTDTAFGFILFILFLALLGYAAGGVSSYSSTAGTTDGTYQSLPSLEGSSVSSCPDGTPDNNKTDGIVDLQIYEDPAYPGRKCATASTTYPGTLKVTLAYTADESQMVSNTKTCQGSGQVCTASVQVNGTDNYCVSAVAAISGTTTAKVTIQRVVEPCMLTVPAGQPDSRIPARSDDWEDEEGY
jgi:hypothetical protein